MPRKRQLYVVGHGVRLALFVLLGTFAIRFLTDTLSVRGWSPAAFFGILLLTGAAALVWRASIDLRKAVRRLRA